MADCYIVRRGGTGEEKRNTDYVFSIGYAGLIPPILDILISKEETEE